MRCCRTPRKRQRFSHGRPSIIWDDPAATTDRHAYPAAAALSALKCGLQLVRQRRIEVGGNPHLSFQRAGLPCRLLACTGTSLAAGLPALAMTISSPCDTASISLENCVLAS